MSTPLWFKTLLVLREGEDKVPLWESWDLDCVTLGLTGSGFGVNVPSFTTASQLQQVYLGDAIWGIFLLCLYELVLWWQMSPDIVIVSHSASLYNPQMPLQSKLGPDKKHSIHLRTHTREAGNLNWASVCELTGGSVNVSSKRDSRWDRASWTPCKKMWPNFPKVTVFKWFPYNVA